LPFSHVDLSLSLSLFFFLQARTGLAQKRDPAKEAFTLATKSISMHPNHDGVRKYATGMITEWNNPSFAARFAPGAQSGQITPAGSAPNSHRGPAHGPNGGSGSVISSSSGKASARGSALSTPRAAALANEAADGALAPSLSASDKSSGRPLRSSRRETPPNGVAYKV